MLHLLACLLCLLRGAGVAMAAPGANDTTLTTIRVCPRNGNFGEDTTICEPDSNCTGGYEFKLFVDAWNTMSGGIKSKYRLEWQPCRSYSQIIAATELGECDVSFGSITAAAVGDRANLTFRGTSLNGALIVAVKKSEKQNRLAATAPFSQKSKDIITVICGLFVGAWLLDYLGRWVIYYFRQHDDEHPRPPFLLHALREDKALRFFGTSLMVLVAVVTIQLLFAILSSYLTSALLLDNPGRVSSVADLKKSGKPIWTSRSYGQRAGALGFRNVQAAQDPVAPQKWYEWLVETETIGGILLDDVVLINFAQLFPDKVLLLREPLAPYSLAFAWNLDVPQEVTVEFERAVRVLWDTGYVEQHVKGLLNGQGFATYTFGEPVGISDNTDRKFNVMDIAEFRTAFIAALVIAGLVYIAKLGFQIVMERREAQEQPSQPGPADPLLDVGDTGRENGVHHANGAGAA